MYVICLLKTVRITGQRWETFSICTLLWILKVNLELLCPEVSYHWKTTSFFQAASRAWTAYMENGTGSRMRQGFYTLQVLVVTLGMDYPSQNPHYIFWKHNIMHCGKIVKTDRNYCKYLNHSLLNNKPHLTLSYEK